MKHLTLFLNLLFALLLVSASPVSGAPAATPPSIAGSGHLLLDMGSNQVLSASNIDDRLEPASLTKILTAYVVFREIKRGHIALSDMVLVSEKAWRVEGSRMFIEVGKQVSVEDLLKGMIIASGNDAAVALAEHTAGSEEAFANLMNEHAQRLGMTNSNFMNASGLPGAEHYTTPSDIARVTIAQIREFPEWYRWYAVKEFTFNDITQPNRNQLLWRDESVDGVKTGHTSSAGYCLVSSAKRDDMRLVSVVMGTDSEAQRATETQKLLGYGFRFFENQPLYRAGDTVQNVRIWKGQTETLAVGVASDLSLTVPRGRSGDTQAQLMLNGMLQAPVSRGQTVGVIEVINAGKVIRRVPAVALADVGEAGIFGQLVDSVFMLFE